MPSNYTVSVTIDGFPSIDMGSMLDGLEIISGSTSPYELPQPPSARASFLGLPVISGVTQTPEWWIGKRATFTVTPQGATGTVTWTGEVQSVNCSAVEHSANTQEVEINLLSVTSKLANALLQSEFIGAVGVDYWLNLPTYLTLELSRTSWAETPAGLTWAATVGTWNTYNNNTENISFAWSTNTASTFFKQIPSAGRDILTFITDTIANKYKGWVWYDNASVTFNAPSNGYLNYTQLTTLAASSAVMWSSLASSANYNTLINNANIASTEPTNSWGHLDPTSYQTYGARYYDFGVTYEALSPVQYPPLVLADKVNAYKNPNKYLQAVTIDLDKLTHVTGEWQNFYKSTKPVRLPITGIPAAYGGDHTYMVRGVQLSLTRNHAETTLVVVPSTIYNPS